jgi:hypothetical protein
LKPIHLTREQEKEGDNGENLKKNIHSAPLPMISLEELFCQIDDFCQSFEPQWRTVLLGNGLKHRQRRRALSLSEIMTILIQYGLLKTEQMIN